MEHLASLRVGTPAADFSFEIRDGRPMLLLFYDPDCDHCMQTIAELSGSELLNGAVARGDLVVVAVYAGFDGSDRAAWLRTLNRLPSVWTVDFDRGTIYTRDLYE